MIVLVFGAPGTGKSTHARYLAGRLGLPWISAGALLREKAREDERLSRLIASGDLLPPELVDPVVMAKLAGLEEGFVLDGYPRTVPQARSFLLFLERRSWRIDCVYQLKVRPEIVLERLLVRGRDDDRPEVIRRRLTLYQRETEPALQVLREAGVEIVEVDNSRPLEEVQRWLDASVAALRRRGEAGTVR